MFDNKEVASRHLPVARGPVARVSPPAEVRPEAPRPSAVRLQATVVADRTPDECDPYADVPCTD